MDLDEARRLLAGAGLEIEDLAPMDGGTVHHLYELRASDGRAYVLKLYRGELSWKLDKETYLLDLVHRRLSIPVPEIVHTKPAVLVMTRLPGGPARFTEDDPVAVSRQLGALLRELHTIELDGFGYIETRVTNPVQTNLEYMRRRVEAKLRNGPPHLREPIARYVADRESAFAGCETAVLCHNDAHDANVLVENGRITGLIDWENAVAADPVFDLAKSWAFSDGRSEETLDALADGYGPLRPDWREALDLYVIDHLLELWVWFVSIGVTDPLPELEGYLTRRVGHA
jgi:Ser/Thr protein kinase RdoA (MazF antagonist)